MQKLLNIQKRLKAPKNQYNSFGKYKYRSCEDILEALKPLCVEENVVLTLSDEIINVKDRYYIKATATLTDENTCMTVTAYAREEESKKGMDGSQITGTASSYARKYALNGLFCIDDTKDADTDEFTSKTNVETKDNRQERIKYMIELAKKHGYEESKIAKKYNKSSVNFLKNEEIEQAIAGLEKLSEVKK